MNASKNMKKICVIGCLVFAFLFSAVACNNNPGGNGGSTSGSEEASATVGETTVAEATAGETTAVTTAVTTAATTVSPDPMEFESGIGDGGAETGDGWKS